ncbi:MAG: DUF433 domain-containing protein [Planctomycetales bacterium]|nr:DUF433 domain-containing protein [Planctomycetales bacterium]
MVRTPGVCGGEPRIAGTRIPVRVVEAYRRAGATLKHLGEAFPEVPRAGLRAALRYAATNRTELSRLIRANETA